MAMNIFLAVLTFILSTYILWKLTYSDYIKEYNEKARKIHGARVYYWSTLIMYSGGITTFVVLMIK